ncbi:MAG: acyltransferase family protein, partial [Alteraurantiacibacter sp.]
WLFSGGYFAGPTDYLPMLHTWSLAVEEQYYIFFPLLLMAIFAVRRGWLKAVIWASVVVSVALAVWLVPRSPSSAFYLLPTRAWELGAGALLAIGAVPQLRSQMLREALSAFGFALIAFAIFTYEPTTPFPGLAALPPVLGSALIIYAGQSGSSLVGRALSVGPMVFVGLISYSLYLWHWPIMALWRNLNGTVHLDQWERAIAIVAAFVLATISWRFVERPFRAAPASGGFSRGRIFAFSGAGMAALGAVCAALLLTNGGAFRFAPEERQAARQVLTAYQPAKNCGGARSIDRLCRFPASAEEGEVDWLLWGDSHARGILPAVAQIAEERGHVLAFGNKGGCPPLPGVYRSDVPMSDNDSCSRMGQRMLDHALETPGIETVVIVARWTQYVEGNRTIAEPDGYLTLVPRNGPGAGESNAAIIETRLGAIIDRLRGAGKNVVLFGTFPEADFEVTRLLQDAALFGRPAPETLSRAYVDQRQARTDPLLRRIAAEHGASYVSLADAMCGKGPTCPIRIGERSLYRDNNHISDFGAEWVVPRIAGAFPQ